MPAWLRRPIAHAGEYRAVEGLLDELHLATVCQEAKCPNRGECYASGTATFLIAGDACTRGCRFCA
ncbi:MAG: lipoyl synthase, partial [Coriobacteriia bacterium]